MTMNNSCIRRYNVDENLFKHFEIDLDFSCDKQGTLNKCVIYILSDMFTGEEKILYVGQTNVNPRKRIKVHMSNLKFSHIYIMQLDTNDRNDVNKAERDEIHKLKPILQNYFTVFERENDSGQVTYDYIIKWFAERDKRKIPGRPKSKVPKKQMNIRVPIALMEQVEPLLPVMYGSGFSEYVTRLIEKDLEENYEKYLDYNSK